MYLYQNNKACENLLLYILKHDISRKSAVQLLLFFRCKKYVLLIAFKLVISN